MARLPRFRKVTREAAGRGLVVLAAVSGLGALAVPAHAQGASSARSVPTIPSSADGALAEQLARIEGDPISLEAAIARALGAATQARGAEAELQAAEGAVRRERGRFDPVLFADLELRDDDQPNTFPLDPVEVLQTEERGGSAGARIRFPTGTEVELSVESTRRETNSGFEIVNPEYVSLGRIEVRQPLLRGFGPSARGELSATERTLEAASSSYEGALLDVQAAVATAYWDLYAAERDLAVQRVEVNRAEIVLRDAQSRARAGLVGPSEVATARAFLAGQRLDAFDREEELDEISDRLASLIGSRPIGAARYHPITEPTLEPSVPSVAEAMERARAGNRDLESARRSLAAALARARGARWDALPALDLTGSLGGNGLSGESVPFVTQGGAGPETLRVDVGNGLGDSIGDVLQQDFPTWSVGLHLTFPIGLREDRGERDRLRAEVRRAEVRVVETERDLEEQVRSVIRRLENASERLRLAREGVDASFEQARIGQIEYRNGRTTAFELVRLGADVAEAQGRYSDALVRAAKAAAELERLAPTRIPEPPRKETP